MIESGKYDITETSLIDNIDNGSIIYFLNIIVALLSWVGILLSVLYVVSWILEKLI